MGDSGAAHVRAFDLDPDMVRRTRGRLTGRIPQRADVATGDVTAIDAAPASFDAVFDFGIIHHVPDWRAALDEVARVLKPGGPLFFEEVTRHAPQRWTYRTFLDHPKLDRFSGTELVEACEQRGLAVGDRRAERFFGDFVLGVAVRDGAAAPEPS